MRRSAGWIDGVRSPESTTIQGASRHPPWSAVSIKRVAMNEAAGRTNAGRDAFRTPQNDPRPASHRKQDGFLNSAVKSSLQARTRKPGRSRRLPQALQAQRSAGLHHQRQTCRDTIALSRTSYQAYADGIQCTSGLQRVQPNRSVGKPERQRLATRPARNGCIMHRAGLASTVANPD